MNLILFAINHYVWVALLFITGYGVGRVLFGNFRFASAFEEVAVCAALGIGLCAQLIFLLGLAHLLYRSVLGAAVLAALFAGRREIVAGFRRSVAFLRDSNTQTRLAVLIVGAAILFAAIQPLYPPHLWDAMSYHLPSARIYAQAGAVRPTPYLLFCVFTQLNEMLFTAAFLVSDAITAQGVQFLLLLLALAAIAALSLRLVPKAMPWAVAAFVGIPEVVLLSSTAYIDIGLMLFVTLFLLAFHNWWTNRDPVWLVTAGLFGGLAASTKYTALFFVGCAGVGVLAHAFRKRTISPLLRFVIPLVLVAGPWYLYIYLHTGNPVFPFLSGIFGPGCWTAADIQHVQQELSLLGTPRTLKSLLHLPWNLAFRQDRFLLNAGLSPFLFLGLPIWLTAGILSRRTRALGVIALLYTLFWFFAAQVPRYLLPMFPLFSLFLAQALFWIVRRFRWNIAILVIPVTAGLLYPSARFLASRFRLLRLPPATVADQKGFFARYPTYDCYDWLNSLYGNDYAVYAFDPMYMRYFANGTRIGDVAAVGAAGRFGDVPTNGTELRRRLERFHAQFVLFTSAGELVVPPLSDPYFKAHFALSWSCGAGTLWRISPEPLRPAFGPQLVDHGGFEELGATRWHIEPTAHVDSTGMQSFSGQTAIRINPNAIELSQALPVSGDRRYEIDFEARGEAQGAAVRFITSWFDRDHRSLKDDIINAPTVTQWHHHTLYSFSPPGATAATIYPESLHAAVWYDDVSFRALFYQRAAEPSQAHVRSMFGVFREAGQRMYIRRSISPGYADEVVPLPQKGIPIAGDWDGDGKLEAGLYQPATGTFYLQSANGWRVVKGESGGLPIAGDWAGSHRWSVGVFNQVRAEFVLYMDGPSGKPIRFRFGLPKDLPIAGDWDGDGTFSVGTYRPSTGSFHLRNHNTSGPDERAIRFGTATDIPVAGDWNAEGMTSVGVFNRNEAVFRLRNQDGSETVIPFGIGGDYPFAASERSSTSSALTAASH